MGITTTTTTTNQLYQAKHIITDFNDIMEVPFSAHNICPTFQLQLGTKTLLQMVQTQDGAVILYMFLCTLWHILIITDDVESYDMEKPLPLHQI